MSQDIRDYRFKVTCLQAGQPRPYADSYYSFEIETDVSEQETRRFCTAFLRPCRQTYAEWKKGDETSYFAGYYTFEKIDTNRYCYKVVTPFCG